MNPISAARRVTSDFLKYQLTAFPFSDARLYRQLRELLCLDEPLETPLLKGPYISLSRAFRAGPPLTRLAEEGVVHPHIGSVFSIPNVHGHQERAIRAIAARKNTVVSTGTGSGKTECFLIPLISHCLNLRDQGEPAGIRAVIVYPMNALAEDQLGRMRELLVGTGIPFAMYVGKTPESEADVTGVRCGPSRADYQAKVQQLRDRGENRPVLPPEEVASREILRAPGKQPRILLTNVKMLELLLTRATDVELFGGARLDFLVVDEAHTFRGAEGAEAALLMRRLRTYCGQTPDETISIATSATLADPGDPEPAKTYMTRFFGVDAGLVEVVNEDYQEEEWANTRFSISKLPEQVAVQFLEQCLDALDKDETHAGAVVASVYKRITNRNLPTGEWRGALYEDLTRNENAYRLSQELKTPCALDELCERLDVTPYEVLLWLTLGSAARRDGRPLLRPVVHTFVRGIDGAVVGYPAGTTGPRLWLSTEDAEADEPNLSRLGVMTCNNCGLHYYPTWIGDYVFTANQPTGGHASGEGVFWPPLDEAQGGCRAVLTDPLRQPSDDDDDGDRDHLPKGAAPIEYCRHCGGLNRGLATCGNCGQGDLVPLLAIKMDGDRQPAKMEKCVSCGSGQRTFFGQAREPARPVRATVVSDVHVLSQNLLQHANTAKKRLLVFADSRQDAAFQAGWMRDHSRRFRLRAMVDEILRASAVPLGLDDIVDRMAQAFDAERNLSQALIPEVWEVQSQTSANLVHERERKDYLKLFLMREMAVQQRQKAGLEPWGRARIDYRGVDESDAFFSDWSRHLGMGAEELAEGVRAMLDLLRRGYCIFDEQTKIFTQVLEDSNRWIQHLYIPTFDGAPAAIKLKKPKEANRIKALSGSTKQSLGDRAARLWGVGAAAHDVFLEELWQYLVDKKVLRTVEVLYDSGKRAKGFDDAYQIDGGAVWLRPQNGLYRCGTCRKIYCRPLPKDRCLHHRCGGTVSWEAEDPDDYHLMSLREGYEMVRPREHSAQVPDADREKLEIAFKGNSDEVNTIVCTPTLEMGVDIGALDSVLLRNVPPLPANYWQRVGRAGRRHRIALNFTYARPSRHDRAYFRDPMKMLGGKVEAPRFNLRNPVMVRKHVRSIALASLQRLSGAEGVLAETERQRIKEALRTCLPSRITPLLFDENGAIRSAPSSVAAIQEVIAAHLSTIHDDVRRVFEHGWPSEIEFLVAEAQVRNVLCSFGDVLSEAVHKVFRRLRWAQDQQKRLAQIQIAKGTLDKEDEALHKRCVQLVKRLKGEQARTRAEGEGVDDSLTYSILAAEGFLPGYGLSGGGVRGYADPYRASKFVLGRSSATGLREFVPGNLIYANNRRFFTSNFQIGAGNEMAERSFVVDAAAESISDVAGANGVAARRMEFIAACDVDLQQRSLISDEEEMRFMMPVAVFVREEGIHGQGQAYDWGGKTLDWRPQVGVLMANVGESRKARQGEMGFLICRVCGQARSPYASTTEVNHFLTSHRERCGKQPERIGIYARDVVDTLRLRGCTRAEAYSVGEAVRMGASRVLEMETEDVHLAAVPDPGSEGQVDLLIMDPMPGGSGLLQQMIEKWSEVIAAALDVVEHCPADCQTSCIDCLQTYRNQQYHPHLDRQVAANLLRQLGDSLALGHIIPARVGTTSSEGQTTNAAEERLRRLLERAGFQSAKMQHRIDLPQVSSYTVVDFYLECESGNYEGVCLYLDGLGTPAHGTEHQQHRDLVLRSALEGLDYAVVAIPASDLNDRNALTNHFVTLGRAIAGKSMAQGVRTRSEEWWEDGQA